MWQLVLAAGFFLGIHLVLSGSTVREGLVNRFGERVFRIGFSVLSPLGLAWLIQAYRGAPYLETWGQLAWTKPAAVVLMVPAVLLIVLGLTTPNPTAVGTEGLLNGSDPARGVVRVTRHPFLWGLAIWAAVHVVANGDWAALVLFGSLLVLVLVGMASIDRKRQRAFGETWDRFAEVTSVIPFAAIRSGRNRWRADEIGWWRPLLGLLIYLALLHFHRAWFGVSPLL